MLHRVVIVLGLVTTLSLSGCAFWRSDDKQADSSPEPAIQTDKKESDQVEISNELDAEPPQDVEHVDQVVKTQEAPSTTEVDDVSKAEQAEVEKVAEEIVKEEKKAKPWTGSNASFGGQIKGGNGAKKEFNTKLDMRYALEKWKNSVDAEYRFGSSRAKGKTAQRITAGAETDYFFLERNYAFALGNYDRDKFSPYEFVATYALGYGQRILEVGPVWIDMQMGPGMRHDKEQDSNKQRKKFIAHVSGEFNWDMSETMVLNQTVKIDRDNRNTYTKAVTSITAKMIERLALQISFTIESNTKIPENSSNKYRTDTTTNIAMVYSL